MRSFRSSAAILAAMLFPIFFIGCELKSVEEEPQEKGRLRLRFDANPIDVAKVSMDMPDTNDFLLTIEKENGTVVFDDLYCNAEEEFLLEKGTYRVYVRSEDFEKPAFSQPQYGDEQCVVVPAGGDVGLHLQCRQINSGVRLDISSDFLTEYPDGVLFLKSDAGKLMYSYNENRIAYFKPGSISLMLSNLGKDEILMTRVVEAQEILTLKVSVLQSGRNNASGLSISLDTTRIWSHETYVIGDEGKGSDYMNALTVSQALASAGMEDVWVNGFIVGGDLTPSAGVFEPPFKSATNLILASRASVSSRNNCIAVQLPSGDIREALNLVSNPELLGRQVCLNGDIVSSYYGLTGLKNVSDFVLK